MAYVDFPYYQDFFNGTLITDEAMFRTFAERASEFIDTATFDRLTDEELLNRHKDRIQKCACVLSEQFFRRNIAVFNGTLSDENMPKTSESIGAYSVSYVNYSDYVQEVSMTDADFQKSLKGTVLRYLGNTGLLYRGEIMFTNMNNCTIYEKAMQNRAYTFIRHEVGAVYWENSCGQKDGKDRVPDNSALVIIPEKSADYVPKADDKIVCGIIPDERPPSTAMTIVKVRDFRYGSPDVRHWEVNAE